MGDETGRLPRRQRWAGSVEKRRHKNPDRLILPALQLRFPPVALVLHMMRDKAKLIAQTIGAHARARWMLSFHQKETCEGIIQHLEMREHTKRCEVQVRDIGNHTSPDARVEMTFRFGDQLYAIEHTGIEPFDGFMEHQNRSRDLFKPLEAGAAAALGALLAPGVVIEMHMPVDAPRTQRACDDKFPKLAMWKQSDNARTILVLEDNDVQFTNQSIVADAFLPTARARADAPDETYLVSTCTSPWYAWPILVNGRSYFELAEITHPIHFEMDATGQLIRPA
jgi:hypothetical protein